MSAIPAALPRYREVDSLDALAEALDAASHEERLAWIRRLRGRQIKELFHRAEGRPVFLDDLVDPAGPVVCQGKNGLMLFNRFAKVFARVGDEVVGYNLNPAFVTFFVGPGHFLASEGGEAAEGEVLIDYRRLPERTHPDFPALVTNDRALLPRLVYGTGMYDLLRRVSRDVFVGDAFRKLPGGAAFILVRPPR